MGVHLVASFQEDQGVVADGCSCLCEELEVASVYGGVGYEGVACCCPSVAYDEVWSEEPCVVKELDGGPAVHPEHVLELDDPLGGVDGDGGLELVGFGSDGFLEVCAVGVYFVGVEGGYESAIEGVFVFSKRLINICLSCIGSPFMAGIPDSSCKIGLIP